jgi:hypothetical protein
VEQSKTRYIPDSPQSNYPHLSKSQIQRTVVHSSVFFLDFGKGVKALCENCKELTDLNLSNTSITDNAILYIVQNTRGIKPTSSVSLLFPVFVPKEGIFEWS